MTLIVPSRASLNFFGGAPGPFRGALISKNADQSITTPGFVTLLWQTEVYDVGGWFEASFFNFMEVPAGVSRVRLSACVNWDGSAGTYKELIFRKNSSPIAGLPASRMSAVAVTHPFVSAVIEVVPGDRLALVASHDEPAAVDILSSVNTFFGVEAVR